MIDFDLFCDITKYLENSFNDAYTVLERPSILNANFKESLIRNIAIAGLDIKKHLHLSEANNEFISLLEQCDKKTIMELIEWFERDAPIQRFLHKRLSELDKLPNKKFDVKLLNNDNTFFKYLCELIDNKGYLSDSDFYNYAGISRQSFSKIRNNSSKVSREMAIHIAVALELDYSGANELLNLAGYSLKSTSRRDAIISYIMRNKSYKFQEMNEILYLFGEKTFLEY